VIRRKKRKLSRECLKFLCIALLCIQGVSINTFDLKNKMFPMVYAGDVPNTAGGYNSSTCRYHNMNPYVIFPCLFFFQKKLKKGL